MLVHDIIKIRLSEEGFLPDFPYHLISDEEMVDAFMYNDENMFDVYYPCPDDSLSELYDTLRSFIGSCLSNYLEHGKEIPDWVYSYMLGRVVNVESNQKDIHDVLVLLGADNLYDEFDVPVYKLIYKVSCKALGSTVHKDTGTVSDNYRPATIFAEPHIIKYLRLEQVSTV